MMSQKPKDSKDTYQYTDIEQGTELMPPQLPIAGSNPTAPPQSPMNERKYAEIRRDGSIKYQSNGNIYTGPSDYESVYPRIPDLTIYPTPRPDTSIQHNTNTDNTPPRH
ncbi:hypothetical protein QAD02_008213 [Eretmocerus hayati]|uniref:Uncharacterized protein n=1 Tax=Eretmocerus hayati TaxID=131215 RepID=A0ACC2N790_9HYME|nr:hypothetical protein QAD02_008213 [Eretmocerus hayati]